MLISNWNTNFVMFVHKREARIKILNIIGLVVLARCISGWASKKMNRRDFEIEKQKITFLQMYMCCFYLSQFCYIMQQCTNKELLIFRSTYLNGCQQKSLGMYFIHISHYPYGLWIIQLKDPHGHSQPLFGQKDDTMEKYPIEKLLVAKKITWSHLLQMNRTTLREML